jgi:hypothetical protein
MLSRQLRQQSFCLLEVGGVKALRAPAVDRREQVVGLVPLALLLPEPTQAHGGPHLQRFGLLATRHREGSVKAGLGLVFGRHGMAS